MPLKHSALSFLRTKLGDCAPKSPMLRLVGHQPDRVIDPGHQLPHHGLAAPTLGLSWAGPGGRSITTELRQGKGSRAASADTRSPRNRCHRGLVHAARGPWATTLSNRWSKRWAKATTCGLATAGVAAPRTRLTSGSLAISPPTACLVPWSPLRPSRSSSRRRDVVGRPPSDAGRRQVPQASATCPRLGDANVAAIVGQSSPAARRRAG